MIHFELHEMDTVIECIRCQCRFTPGGGPVGEGTTNADPPAPPPLRRTAQAAGQAPPAEEDSSDEYEVEPWYYRFLTTYASVLTWLALITFSLSALGVLGAILVYIADSKSSSAVGPGVFLAVIVVAWAVNCIVGILLWVAFIRLAVDAGRSLRDIRRLLRLRRTGRG